MAPQTTSMKVTDMPEFQEQLSYQALTLMHMQMPECKDKCTAQFFWKRFQQRNRTSLGATITMLQVLFPAIQERQAFRGRTKDWCDAVKQDVSPHAHEEQ